MKQLTTKLMTLLMVFVLASSLILTGCKKKHVHEFVNGICECGEKEEVKEPGYQMPEDEYRLPKEEGHNQITFYWTYPGTIENADIWVWWDGKEGSGYLFHECDYGVKAVINVPEGIEQVGFIVRRDCSEPGGSAWGTATKDFGEDRFAVIEGTDTFIYLKTGDGAQYSSEDGGKTLVMIKKFTLAGMTTFNKIEYSLTPKTTISSYSQVKVLDGDRELTIVNISTMGKAATTGIIEVDEDLDLSKTYVVEIEEYGQKPVVPTDIFDSTYFIENYTYDGNDLGAVINGDSTTFKLWAPTASKIVLNLFEKGNGGSAYKTIQMTKGEKGVWSHTEAYCGHGVYYTYTVTTSVGTQEAVDPYAKAAGLNGNRGMVVDLSKTNPEGWENDDFESPIDSYSDAVIWEVHVRDFSNKIASSNYKGKYLAFTERGLVNSSGIPVGVDYLVELGITHVHLLPVYDYATVDEANPDSQFNWGYDPKNYNVPEGSYSTDPYNGEVRIKEYKQMVQALHEAGIGVIMDVVYNHTYDANSSFNKIVPYYYYRYTATGANSSASGCGNDTASERKMFGKFMVDSVSYWAEEYNLDGFRFDLMGLHDLYTMQDVESAVHTINPKAVIYGEGWTMGSTITNVPQANQTNISKITPTNNAIGGIAVFNDAIRDGLKGSVFSTTAKGYISGNTTGEVTSKVQFGIRGGTGAGIGWTVKNSMVVNYMSAHDNNTLWDKLLLSNPEDSEADRVAMNKLGAAILMISKGMPFIHAGEEMLRTKDGDENSYKSSDEINNIDWEALTKDSIQYKTMLYYKELIAMRKAYDMFTNPGGVVSVMFENLANGAMVAKFTDNSSSKRAVIIINPSKEALTYDLVGDWKLIANENTANAEGLGNATGTVTVNGISIQVYVNH